MSAQRCFPVIQIGLRLFQALEALPFQRCFLRVADAGFDFPFAIGISHAAWQRDGAVVRAARRGTAD